jgi:hypothetical protein
MGDLMNKTKEGYGMGDLMNKTKEGYGMGRLNELVLRGLRIELDFWGD